MDDALEDNDARFFDESRRLISEIHTDLRQLLLRDPSQHLDAVKLSHLRKYVRRVPADALLHKLNIFQQWPQLLDPLLVGKQRLLELLTSALLAEVEDNASHDDKHPKKIPEQRIPMVTFICTVLYTLCKLRGHKVISRSFNHERDKLRKVLDYFLFRKLHARQGTGDAEEKSSLRWKETYIMLLWIALLVTIPFPLSAVGDGSVHADLVDLMPQLPPHLPTTVHDVLRTAVSHIFSPSKDGEASALLLAKLVTRPDMQKEGLPGTFVRWALQCFERAEPNVEPWPHSIIGPLSFLTSIAKAAPKEVLEDQVQSIWAGLMKRLDQDDAAREYLRDSAVMTRLLLKIFRTTCSRMFDVGITRSGQAFQFIIAFLFECAGDKMSAPRFAASKSLGQVALGEKKHSRTQVIEYLFDDLQDDLDWETMAPSLPSLDRDIKEQPAPNFNAAAFRSVEHCFEVADSARWHGYTMALAHMLLSQAVPVSLLSRTCHFISVALNFFQRSLSGVAAGENVRDAACLCVWALARKYTTTQIQSTFEHGASSITDSLQSLTTELVKAACLDSANNIRRAASAALQELIGRHPDHIICGRELSYTVDVEAIAAKSTAFLRTAFKVSLLAEEYHDALIVSLCDSRGLLHPDALVRRLSAHSLGVLSVRTSKQVHYSIKLLESRLQGTYATSGHWRHGLLMGMAAVLDTDTQCQCTCEEMIQFVTGTDQGAEDSHKFSSVDFTPHDFRILLYYLYSEKAEYEKRKSLEGDLVIESVCALLQAISGKIRAQSMMINKNQGFKTDDLNLYISMAMCGLTSLNIEIRHKAGEAVLSLLTIAPLSIQQLHADDLVSYFQTSSSDGRQRTIGYITLLGFLFASPITGKTTLQTAGEWRSFICSTLHEQAVSKSTRIDQKCAAVRSMIRGPLSSNYITPSLLDSISLSLNDYTYIDQGGDIGSILRLDAIEAAVLALQHDLVPEGQSKDELILYLCALACESLDRLRFKAGSLLHEHWKAFGLSALAVPPHVTNTIDTTTPAYFLPFLQIATSHPSGQGLEVLHGFVTSASSTSNPSLCHAARTALLQYLSSHPHHLPLILQALSGFKHEGSTRPSRRRPERLRRAWVEVVAFVLESLLPGFFSILRQEPSVGAVVGGNLGRQPIVATESLNENKRKEEGEARAPTPTPKFFHNLFAATTRSHYQSHDLRLLEAAVGVYYALAAYLPPSSSPTSPINNNNDHKTTKGNVSKDQSEGAGHYSSVRKEAMQKLIAMLSAPFPRIRDRAADALLLVLGDEAMLGVDHAQMQGQGQGKGERERERLKGIVMRMCGGT